MLASTAARVLGWYFRSRARLDAPVRLELDGERAEAYLSMSGRARGDLLAEVGTVSVALAWICERDRLILLARYDPDRGVTDRELAQALHCDREGARGALSAALLALGGQLVRMGLIHMNGRPTFAEAGEEVRHNGEEEAHQEEEVTDRARRREGRAG